MYQRSSKIVILGAWLLAAPFLFSQQAQIAVTELIRYSLEESPAQLNRVMGAPRQIAESSVGYYTWYYQTDVADQHDYSHMLMFRKDDNKLVSVTRNFHTAVNVDALFPEKFSKTYYYLSGRAQDLPWPVRVRAHEGDRLTIGMGVAKAGDMTTQVLIVRRSILGRFLPWLEVQLQAEDKARR